MKESKYRSKVVKLLQSIFAFPVENEVFDGQPDICTVIGWIEMKLGELQQRTDSRVVVKMRPSQRIWHKRWRSHGAKSWTITVVEDAIWYLHDGAWSAEHLGEVDEKTLRANAIAVWTGGPSSDALIEALTRRRS